MRSPWTGAVAGVVLLAAMFGFVVGLPEAVGEDPESAAELPVLPDELPGGLVPLDELDVVSDPALIVDQAEYGADRISELFGAEAETRVYGREEPQAVLSLTVIDREAGMFLPEGPPYDPALIGQETPNFEMVEVDGAVCTILYGTPEQAAQTGGAPIQVDCQLGQDGQTLYGIANGLAAEEVVEILHALAED